jgi:endonuclease/exonuclease/phosphatase family metal-dependent hydrolase
MPRKTKTEVKKDRLYVFIEWLAHRPILTELLLTAVTVLFGMQILRVLIPDISWILGGRFGLGPLQMGLIGIAIFLLGFLAGPLSWVIGNRHLVTFTVAVMGLVRLLMQVLWDLPFLNFILAILGVILFIIFLPAGFEEARRRGGTSISYYAVGLLGGLALDTAINGTFGTYDVIWQAALLPVLLTLLIFILQLVLLIGTTPAMYHENPSAALADKPLSLPRSFTWLAIGPFLFLELVVFQNIPRLSTLTGWSLPIAFILTLIGQLAGIAVATLIVTKNWRMLWPWALGAGIILIATLFFGYQQHASLIAALFVIGQVLVSAVITMVVMGIASSTGKARRSTIWIANGIGTILFIFLVLAYYAVYEIKLPYPNPVIELVAGGIITACAVGAVIFGSQKLKVAPGLWTVSILALILLALPLAEIITWRTSTPSHGPGLPITVMTYDLNYGFNTKGKLNIDEIAKTIEVNRPDVLALQEVSRGWVTNGRLDMLEYLSHRLQMPYVYGATADQFVGNAILSRYPIIAFVRQSLPQGQEITRPGFIAALVDLGTERIKVIDTQFATGQTASPTRQDESQAIIDFWGGVDSTLLMGDFAAQSTTPEMGKLSQDRLVDASATKSVLTTFPYTRAVDRLDYIWTSPDLRANDVAVMASTASDHLPLVATIDR